MSPRRYRYYSKEPLFPFGFGLSYTAFSLATDQAPLQLKTTDGPQTLRIHVAHAGGPAAAAVVQAYFEPGSDVTGVLAPKTQLFGFEKVWLDEGGAATASFDVSPAALALPAANGDLVAAPGDYALRFSLGDGGADVRVPLSLVGGAVVVEAFPARSS